MSRTIHRLGALLLGLCILGGCAAPSASDPTSGRAPACDTAFEPPSGWDGAADAAYPAPSAESAPRGFDTEEYASLSENRFYSVQDSPLSTFAADVDTASYANLRRFLRDGELPPPDAVRIEELINYFRYDYPAPEAGSPFSCTTEVVDCPWNPDTLLLSVGLAAAPVESDALPPQNLVFLIDVSGSMEGPDRLDLVKRAFLLLCGELRPRDRVSIVTYASMDRVILEGADGRRTDEIMCAIENLTAGGSTNGADGIRTAYGLAEEYFVEGGNNRIILATDGDLNVGVTSESELKRLVEEERESGVFLSVLGFGRGNLKDNKLEILADNGNGNYAYIDSIAEARRALVEDMGGTLLTVAKDVKLQVEFNPAAVKGYRLIGYENRLLAAEDFADDAVDGGELGAGHQVTALYELVPVDSPMPVGASDLKYQTPVRPSDPGGEFCTVSVRSKRPDGAVSELWEYPVPRTISPYMSDNLRLASAVAETGMLLRASAFSGTAGYPDILEQLARLERGTEDPFVAEFIGMVRQLRRLDP